MGFEKENKAMKIERQIYTERDRHLDKQNFRQE